MLFSPQNLFKLLHYCIGWCCSFGKLKTPKFHSEINWPLDPKGGFKSEDTKEFFVAKINIPNHYPEQKIWISCLVGKFEFSAQDSDLEYFFWQLKNSPVSSDLKPPLEEGA